MNSNKLCAYCDQTEIGQSRDRVPVCQAHRDTPPPAAERYLAVLRHKVYPRRYGAGGKA